MVPKLVQPAPLETNPRMSAESRAVQKGLAATILLARLGSMALSSPDAIVTLFVRVAALGATSAASLSRWVSSSGTT